MRASKHMLGRRGRDGDGDRDGEGSSDKERDSAPSAFAPPPFTPTSLFSPNASAASAYPASARRSERCMRGTRPHPNRRSRRLSRPLWRRRTLRRTPTRYRRRPPPHSPRPRTHRTHCTHALALRTAPSAVARAVPGQPGQALILPLLTHMYRHLLSVPCRVRSALPLLPVLAPPVGHEYAQYAHAHVQHRALAMCTHAATRCHSRSCHQRMCTGARMPRATGRL
jgi:hypothetical protein